MATFRKGGFMTDIHKLLQEQAIQGEKIESIEETCQEIRHSLLGNGRPGLIVRTDRLEQRDKFKTRLFWLITTAVCAILAKVGFDVFSSIANAGQ